MYDLLFYQKFSFPGNGYRSWQLFFVFKKQPDSLSTTCKNAFKTAKLGIENKKSAISLHSLMMHTSTVICALLMDDLYSE